MTRDVTWKEEWKNMPEFVQEKKEPYKVITIRFRNEEDYKAFAELVEQELTEKTKSMWYPKLIWGVDSNKTYVDEDFSI